MERLLFLPLTLLCACAPKFIQQPAPMIDSQPDIILTSISGRCGLNCSPDDNRDYLNESGTNDRLAQALRKNGYRVMIISGVAQVKSTFFSKQSSFEQHGYPWIKEQLQQAITDHPQAALVVLGHSHGSVFTHILSEELQHPIKVLIDLDTQCLKWTDYRQTPYETACNFLPNQHTYRYSDLVNPRVEYNLELQASAQDLQRVSGQLIYSPVRDRVPNMRQNQQRDRILTLQTRDNHIMMPRPESQSTALITQFLSKVFPAR